METPEQAPVQPEPTFGEKRIRTNFNVTRDITVDQYKHATATLIDQLKALSDATSDPEVKRLCSMAMTDYESAAMWAVKAATAGK